MGSIVLGSIGSAIGGPIGGMIGGQLGSFIDQRLFRKNPPKPNPADLLVQSAVMGLPWPVAYGRCKIAGNLIVSTNIIPKLQHGGGKGGLTGGGQAYYTYSFTGAVGICKGPINNIWRIYADTKVIWDMDPITTAGGTPLPQSGFIGDQFGAFATFYHFGQPGTKDSNTQLAGGNAQFYYGTEEQEPDGALTALAAQFNLTPDYVPAFRGLAYCVFMNFPLADYGNRIPSFSFEVNGFHPNTTSYTVPPLTGNPTILDPIVNLTSSTYWQSGYPAAAAYNMMDLSQLTYIDWLDNPLVSGPSGVVPGGGILANNRVLTNDVLSQDGHLWTVWTAGTTFGPTAESHGAPGSWPLPNTHGVLVGLDSQTGVFSATQLTWNWNLVPEMIDPLTLICCGASNHMVVFDGFSPEFQVYDMTFGGIPSQIYVGTLASGDQRMYPTAVLVQGAKDGFSPSELDTPEATFVGSATSAYRSPSSLTYSDSRDILITLDGPAGAAWIIQNGGSLPWAFPVTTANFSSDGGGYCVIYDGKNDVFLFYNNRYIHQVTDVLIGTAGPGSEALVATKTLDILATYGFSIEVGSPFQVQQSPRGTYALRTSDGLIHLIDTSTLEPITSNIWANDWSDAPAGTKPSRYTPVYVPTGQGGVMYGIESSPPSGGTPGVALYRPLSSATITLGEIVQDVSLRCGLNIDQIDVSELTETVYGYTVSTPTSGRSIIEQLEEIFLFDYVESNQRLVGRHRDVQVASPVPAVDPNDLGARSASPMPGDNPVPRVVERYTQDMEIPLAAALRYRSASGDPKVRDFAMQIGTEYARRSHATTTAVGDIALDTPLVLSDDQAAQIISKVLKMQYIQRVALTLSLPIKYIYVEPGDVLPLGWTDPEGNTVSYSMYVKQADFGADNTISLQGTATDATAYVSQAIGGSAITIEQPMTAGQMSTLRMLDVPPLRDSDDDLGLYWEACGQGTSVGWGAVLMRSIDGGQTYLDVGFTSTPAVIGQGLSPLLAEGNARDGVWDHTNTLTITVTGGTPLSWTAEQVLARTGGIYLVGQEIVGACNAVENADGSWTLSLLQRGMLGTDRFISTHLPGEPVESLVISDGTAQDLPLDISQLGVEAIYAAVSVRSSIDDTWRQIVTPTGARLRPESPVNIAVARDSMNNATIFWNPRNRINYEWLDGAEQGTDEVDEAYEIDIYDAARDQIIRTIKTWTNEIGTVGDSTNTATGRRQSTYLGSDQIDDRLVNDGAEWDTSSPSASNFMFSNGNLSVAGTGGLHSIEAKSPQSTGRYVWQVTPFPIGTNTGIGVRGPDGTSLYGTGFFGAYSGFIDNGLACTIAVDLDLGLIWFKRSPTEPWNHNPAADPATSTGGFSLAGVTLPLAPSYLSDIGGSAATANFGRSVFSGDPSVVAPAAYMRGWPGDLPPPIVGTIYQISNRIGRGTGRDFDQ